LNNEGRGGSRGLIFIFIFDLWALHIPFGLFRSIHFFPCAQSGLDGAGTITVAIAAPTGSG